MCIILDMSWFIVKTNYRKTIAAKNYYDFLGVENYVPTALFTNKKNKIITKVLLPGYVFIFFKKNIDYNIINSNPFTSDVIRRSNVPLVIPDDQMQLMIDHVESNYNKNDFSSHQVGDSIQISHGALVGLSGDIIEIKNNKIYLQIDSLKAKVEIQY